MDLVSVIIPSFGANTNPQRAVDSVFRQTYRNIEVIFVDDNGVGTAQQIANKDLLSILYKDKKFIYIAHETNRGGSAARNTGVANCNGTYVCFLDDDDEFVDCSKIEKQMCINEILPLEYAGSYSSLHIYRGKQMEIIKAKQDGRFLVEFMKGSTSIGTAAPIIKKDVFRSLDGFDETFIRHQDWEFYCRLLNSYSLKPVPSCYYNRYYKMDVGRKAADVRLEYMNHFAEAMRKQIHLISQNRLERLLKRKYLQVVFAYFREKRIKLGFKVCKENRYNFFDYIVLFISCVGYFLKKPFGKH